VKKKDWGGFRKKKRALTANGVFGVSKQCEKRGKRDSHEEVRQTTGPKIREILEQDIKTKRRLKGGERGSKPSRQNKGFRDL